ncbi:MAG: DUF1007 family protein [Pseudomonadota bacterium]
MFNVDDMLGQHGSHRTALPKVGEAVRIVAIAFTLGVGLTGPAAANPDIWVTVKHVLRFDDAALTEISMDWTFDKYTSDRAISHFDADGDGAFSDDEAKSLRVEAFDPLAQNDYFVQLETADQAIGTSVDGFRPWIDGDLLVFSFNAVPQDPVAYRQGPVSLSLYDRTIYFDFSFAEENFLLVDGPFDTACRFRIESGDWPLEAHKKTVVLLCGE